MMFTIQSATAQISRARSWYDAQVPLLRRSPLLDAEGFQHGFSTRLGGVSLHPYASMNLARSVGDDPVHVEENYRRVAEALGVSSTALFETTQVHGSAVRRVNRGDDVFRARGFDADALVTTSAGIAVGVRVADCVPILLADPSTGAVAAVHAGWRGCVARVLASTMDTLVEAGAEPSGLVAAIGPHIGPAAFEVDEQIAAEIAASAEGADVIVRGYEKPHVDLGGVVMAQLVALGVSVSRIDRVGGCTYADEALYHSFRRDGKRSGRLFGAIVGRVGSTPAAW